MALYDDILRSVPVNARLFAKSMLSPGKVTEDNFTKEELDSLRKASINSNDRYLTNKGTQGDKYRSRLKELLKLNPNQEVETGLGYSVPAHELITEMMGKLSKSLQYSDYESQSMKKYGSVAKVPVSESFRDPGYASALTVGRGNYYSDNYGNLHINDVYDFPGAKTTQSLPLNERLMRLLTRGKNNEWNPTFGAIHTVGEQFSKEMPVDIQIQHGASGNY